MLVAKVNIQNILRYMVSLCVVLSMLLPIVGQAVDVLSDSVLSYHVMTMDQPEETQQEEGKEDNTKDIKIEMRVLSAYAHLFSYLSKQSLSKNLEAASDFILEIPIPPPEQRSLRG